MRTYNEWRICKVGKCEIVVGRDGLNSHLTHGRVSRVREAAEEYVAARPKLAQALAQWKSERNEAIAAWKHETPHHRYDCDGGCLGAIANGVRLDVHNRHGDGNFPVYIIDEPPLGGNAPGAIPPTFEPVGVLLRKCGLEILDYDCDGGEALETVDVERASFYVDGTGAVVITVQREEA